MRNDNNWSADPLNLPTNRCRVIAQTFTRRSTSLVARQFHDMRLPALGSERGLNLVP
jgi:hypothetical protein